MNRINKNNSRGVRCFLGNPGRLFLLLGRKQWSEREREKKIQTALDIRGLWERQGGGFCLCLFWWAEVTFLLTE